MYVDISLKVFILTYLIATFRKFNVSITRGMAYCAVIGHPEFLYLDKYWKQMIHQCVRYGSYEGTLPSDMKVDDWQEREEDNLLSSSIRSVMMELGSSTGKLLI